MKSFLLFVLLISLSLILKAETIHCSAKNASSFSLEFSTSNPPTTPVSLHGKLKQSFWSATEDISLKMAPRNNSLNYTDFWNSKKFWLALGSFHGEGHYPEAAFTANRGTSDEQNYTLECDLRGPIDFKNYCSGNPQENLFLAARHVDADLLEAALACSVTINAVDSEGCSPLLALTDINCGTGNFDRFAAYDIKEMVSDLIQAGADTNAKDPVTQETPLLKVAKLQDLESAKLLIAAHADVNAQDKEGMTALMRATENRDLKMIEFFISANARLETKNSKGMTAYNIATSRGYSELTEMLAGVNTVTVLGNKSGVCNPMSFSLKLNQPNKVILKTENSMLMLESQELGINLMAGSGMDATTTITPSKAGSFKMTCGPQMGSGNPQGQIVVQ